MNSNLPLSRVGEKLSGHSGIVELMDDLGQAMGGPDAGSLHMMGGGTPAHIPAIQKVWRERLAEIIADPAGCDRMLTNYDGPAGNPDFLKAVATCLHDTYGWDIGPENVAVTTGGQTAFFCLFTLLAGSSTENKLRRILLPLVPEYIGYADQGLEPDMFVSHRPLIEVPDHHEFKYRIDFDQLQVTPDIAAICVSRPTNPSGNVLTDAEITHLRDLAHNHEIPLIIDNAYGAPFPNAVFTKIHPVWDPGIILTFSLSKIGLPGTRTGIVVAREDIIRKLASMTSIVGLANNNIGQTITRPLLESGKLIEMSNDIINPFYLEKSEQAHAIVREEFADHFPYSVHKSEGAFFLWLWFPELPITSRELYEHLKKRGLLIIPGEYFFYGLDEPWDHTTQCIRITYSQSEETVREGIRILADELRSLHANQR
ncbi:MAG: valine--pyruvate transaminase [Verrucomicrobiota bacterium]